MKLLIINTIILTISILIEKYNIKKRNEKKLTQ